MAEANHFDDAAATWEENPERQALTDAILRAVVERAPLRPDEHVLEYGCGTAALGRALAPQVASVLCLDSSAGMVAEAQRRAQAAGLANLHVQLGDLAGTVQPELTPVDLIVCVMALHHVTDDALLLHRFATLLQPGGVLLVADLLREDGSFHGDTRVPHHGFDPDHLVARLAADGLSDVQWVKIHEMPKNGRLYPVFLVVARRR